MKGKLYFPSFRNLESMEPNKRKKGAE